VKGAKWVAIGMCILFVAGAYTVWNYAFSQFNPNPASTTLTNTYSCETGGTCGEFQIASASLILQGGEGELGNGIQSQSLSLQIDNLGRVPMSSVQVFINNTSVGTQDGPFAPGMGKVLYFPVPTTISVEPGGPYEISVEGTFRSGVPGGSATSYIVSQIVIATS
jgi:hypothetical protein